MGDKYKGAVGKRILDEVREVMTDLGDYLFTEDGKVAKVKSEDGPVGDANAFAHFVKKANKKLPVASSSLVV